jgi:hypothetical protein
MAISEKQRTTVLQCLEQGMSLRKACIEADIATHASWHNACEADPKLDDQYTRARLRGYHARADRLTDDAWDMTIPADHKRIIIDTQKWELSKMLPKLYGERLDLIHSGSVSRTDQLTEAELRAIVDAPPTSK